MGVARAFAPVVVVLALTGAAAAEPTLPRGAAVETEVKARELAFWAYVERMQPGVLAEEEIIEALLLRIGDDVPGFAKRHDQVWEVRIGTVSLGTRALIWVHALSGRVLFVVGPWEQP